MARGASFTRHAASRLGGWLLLLACGGTVASELPSVSVQTVSREPIVRQVQLTGTVTSPRSAMLSPSVGGLIARMEVDAGDHVTMGDLLLKLDDELEALELERAVAAGAEARAALADARRRLAEAERLVDDRSISESEVKSRRAEVEMRQAALQAAEADVGQQRAVVRRHELRAPFDGVISRRFAEVGEWTSPGDSVLELVAIEGLRFDFYMPQEFFNRVTPETRVTLRLDATPDLALEGEIRAIVPVSDPTARTFLLRVTAADAHARGVTPGMSARAVVHIDTGREAVVVPRDALLRYPDGRTTVWVLDRSGEPTVVHERGVRTGLEMGSKIEVTDGLEAGVEVVTRGNESLLEGQAVSLH